VDGLDIRAMVPFSLRRPEEFNKLGNRFGLVLLSLPVGVRDPLQRIHMLKQRMDEIKSSPEALVAFAILGAMGLTPIQVEELILKFFAAKATAVMTNVPGPREPLYLAGQLIRGVMFWAPHPGNLGLGVSIISYNGAVAVGIVTDKGLAPNPDEIVAGFQAEYATMRKAIQPKRRPARQPRAAGLCRAKSRSGQPCRNRALAGGRYCRVHQRS
jgi:hypothetical protein